MDAPKQQPYQHPTDAVWFITGCSSGLGKALAQHAYNSGYRVVATARKVSTIDYLPDFAQGGKSARISLDVTEPGSISNAISEAIKYFGHIDVFVNNAGYALSGDTENAMDRDARDLMDTNFWGTVNVTKQALNILRDVNNHRIEGGRKGGVIMNVTSMGGRVAFAGNAFYHASKFAVEGFTESVAKEVRPEWNIHLCCIEPGGVQTGYISNTKHIEPHPAYTAPDTPSRVLEQYMANPEATKGWAKPENIAKAMFDVVAQGGQIPLHVPLGPDSWGLIKGILDRQQKELEEGRELAHKVGEEGQLESVSFLKE
ncbi:hypothetical protein QBC46DRAFT_390664 [Diplogelasinospora grovesii]|uniref:Uncharacterized protein n=1 Tax=Diplogelasinospora grovesii TaxID=303347 RepID=A0AAN6N2X3_9PEZI|nr:hypothetical protein QBC46DRAFT_390664 [Diplogelasinospora grovesii]